ncbi:ImmA/IrrE family metallo-endopeptidase [Flavobacterium orientale]|uniref:IrrE N-terminal-like domain-containing protein n=1 Tax=Flavobacterium orientale TaxID=1756020 RepID=A0A916Y4M2_9FLAO|nr:ImmA/IrrE family metallo-endopeptidase [Flavobacterium orientale]GGD30409.1 hypothetical protein GCM10011343_20740 [Flavobacterium orientale]
MPLQQKKTYKRGFKKWTDEKVVELRKKLGLYASSPLCAFKLCEFLNVPIFEPSNIQGISTDILDELLVNGSRHWSAATIPLSGGKYIIIHNPTHTSARQQSNLMHELAHILCKHEVSEKTKSTGLSGFLRSFDEGQENEAEWLGSCLQLPKPALIQSLKNEMSLENIAEHYNCSLEMVQYRINVTGVKRQLAFMKSKKNVM